MMRSVLIAAAFTPILLGLVNCGGSTASAPDVSPTDDAMATAEGGLPIEMSDATVPEDAGPAVFKTAAHQPLPQMPKHTNKILTAPHLVTITYASYTYQSQVEDFGKFMVTSSWMTSVGAEFGVLAGTHEERRFPEIAPATIKDAGIRNLIIAKIAASALPAPTVGGQNVYMIYFPATTVITDSGGAKMCGANGSVGYHGSGKSGGIDFAYAVVADCGSGFPSITSTASHELIEAASDPWNAPNDGYFMDFSAPDLWYTDYGDEDADMCQYEADIGEGIWTLQRSYSNVAAAAGGSPCVPAVAGEAYNNVSAMPATMPDVAPGGSFVFTITGWSTLKTAPWKLALGPGDQTDFDPKPVLSGTSITNGDTVTVTLKAPATATAGTIGSAYIFSGDAGHFWPVAIRVR
jgi:hypothetical protein